jgi:hypothetical protein
MPRHGTHARCKNFFFQNMVRTDPYWQQAPKKLSDLQTFKSCQSVNSGSRSSLCPPPAALARPPSFENCASVVVSPGRRAHFS